MIFISRIREISFVLSFCLCLIAFQSLAAETTGDIIANQAAIISNLIEKINNVEKTIEESSNSDEKLLEQRIELEKIEKQILESGVKFRPILDQLNAGIVETAKDTGEKEQNAESEKRGKELMKEKDRVKDLIRTAENLLVRVNALSGRISVLRRNLFASLLFHRYQPQIVLGAESGKEAIKEVFTLFTGILARIGFLFHFRLQEIFWTTFVSILSGLISYYVGNFFLSGLMKKENIEENHIFSIKHLSVAFWSTVLPAGALFISFQAASWLYEEYNIFQGNVFEYFNAFLKNLFVTFFIYRFSRAIFSPDAPEWRLIEVKPRPAYALIFLATCSAFVIGLNDVISSASESLGQHLSVTILGSLLASLLVGIMMAAFAWIKPFRDKNEKVIAWPFWFRGSVFFLSGLVIVSSLAGYISFARFLSAQVIVTGAWMATAYIGLLASRVISEEGNFSCLPLGRWLKAKYNVSDSMMDQFALLISILIKTLIIVVFLPFVLFQWGFKPADIYSFFHKGATGIHIGSFSFSPITLIWGAVVFTLGYIVTRSFQNWLDTTVLTRSQVDLGVRESIKTVIGYAGIGLASLLSISAAGLDLSNLAMIAGALSLGIGFGLQNIVSNFVSGLILLMERPFKPGDWITAGEFSGIVKKINVRATEIKTFSNESIILPNSQIVNSALGNWTHQSTIGRVEIPVMVTQDSDAKETHKALLEVANENSMVLKTPRPFVAFTDFVNTAFGETVLRFEVRVFVGDIVNLSQVKNEICFSIVEKFKLKGIKMPLGGLGIMKTD